MDFTKTENMLRAMAKLRGSTDGAATLWWYRGGQYGVVDMQPRLLWQVEGAQLGKFIQREDGAYEHVFRDVMFYLDAQTSNLLTKFENPFTDVHHEPPVMRMGPFRVQHSTRGARVLLPDNMPPGAMEVEWRYEPVVVEDGDIFIRETGSTQIVNHLKDSGKPGVSTKDKFYINDFFILSGRVDDVLDKDLPSAPARFNYQSINEWTPWLGMGDAPGFVLGTGQSKKLASREHLPARIAGWIAEHEPGFFEDPEFPLWDESYHPLNQDE